MVEYANFLSTLFMRGQVSQSRRDDTLLTVDFNLRTGQDRERPLRQVPQGRHFVVFLCRPCGTWLSSSLITVC